MKIRKITALFLTMAMVVCMTGCVGHLSMFKINADGSGTVVVRQGFTKESFDIEKQLGRSSEEVNLSEMDKFSYNGVDYYGLVQSMEFQSIDELNKILADVSDVTADTDAAGHNAQSHIVFKKKDDGTLVADILITPPDSTIVEDDATYKMISEEEAEKLLETMVVLIEMEFPAEVRRTIGPEIEGVTIEGNTLTINFTTLAQHVSEQMELQFTCQPGDASLIDILPVRGTFKDVLPEQWYYAAVEAMAARGLVNGMGNGVFAPNETITFAQFCNIAAKATDMASGAESGYWGYKAIQSCIDAGIIESRGDIVPANYDVPMPREAAVAGMVRIFGDHMKKATEPLPITREEVPDYDTISPAYQQDVLNAYNMGITNGMDSNKTFSPRSRLSRAQVCQLFYNVYSRLA